MVGIVSFCSDDFQQKREHVAESGLYGELLPLDRILHARYLQTCHWPLFSLARAFTFRVMMPELYKSRSMGEKWAGIPTLI